MLFFLLDLIFWQSWSLLTWCVQYLGPFILLVQLVRLIRADADLTLQMYEKFGMMPSSLRGKVVWITGASSGIGEHLAYVLAKSGCKLCLSARREKELYRVKEACLECHWVKDEDIFVLPLDVLETDKHKELTDKVIEHFGQIDILVNNAAIAHFSLIKDTPLQVDRDVIEIVVIAQIALTKAVLPHFMERKSGHVVVTSSVSGKIVDLPLIAAYVLGKFALMGYFEALRIEHASDNIDVTLVCPGPVESNIQNTLLTAPGQKADFSSGLDTPMMPTERCAQLMAVAMANKLGEVWISTHPTLLATYFGQYFPDCWRWICKKTGAKMVNMTKKYIHDQKD